MGFDVVAYLDEAVLPRLCKTHSFARLDPVAERHGSWEWSFYKKANELNRFVLVALTSLPSTPAEPLYSLEVWAGADDGNRFTRHLISDLRTVASESYKSQLSSCLEAPLLRAISTAESFKPADLTEAYLPSRTKRG